MLAEEAAAVLDREVALDHRLEQVTERGRGGDAGADDQRVRSGQPVLIEPGEPEGHRARDEAGDQPLDGFGGRDARRELGRPPQPPAEVGAGVADERREQHVEQQAVAVVEAEEQHGICEPQADPEDAQQGPGHGQSHVAAERAHDRHQRCQQHRAREREQHLELVAVGGGQHDPREPDEAGERQRAHRRQQPVQLVQGYEPEAECQQREQRPPAVEHDQDRDDGPRRGDQGSRGGGRAPPLSPPSLRRAASLLRHYLPPNRYSRAP